jgi:polysaccharide biosynthesis protein PslG
MRIPPSPRRWLAAAAAVAAVATAVTVSPATSAAAATTSKVPPAVGVQFHGMWATYDDTERAKILDELDAAGTEWIRLDVSWAMLQPTSGSSYDLGWGVPFVDRVVNMVHDRGMHLLVTFWRTPAWANGGASETTLPTDPSTYAAALRWAAARYAGRVDAWEVWNEPNQAGFMTGADPAAYTRLLKAAYPAAHAGDPATTVVFGGPSMNDAPWIARAYNAGAHGYFDAMATHPYMGPSDAAPETPDNGSIYTMAHAAAVHQLMVDNGDGNKPIWFTEYGWSTHANTAEMRNWELGVSRAVQADYLVRSLAYMRDHLPYVSHTFWYEADDRQTGTTRNIDNYGLMDDQLRPKASLTALAGFQAAQTPDPQPTATATVTASPTVSPSASPSVSPTSSSTASPAPTATTTASPAPSPTATATATTTNRTVGSTSKKPKKPLATTSTDSDTDFWRRDTSTTKRSGISGAKATAAKVTARSGTAAPRGLPALTTTLRVSMDAVLAQLWLIKPSIRFIR